MTPLTDYSLPGDPKRCRQEVLKPDGNATRAPALYHRADAHATQGCKNVAQHSTAIANGAASTSAQQLAFRSRPSLTAPLAHRFVEADHRWPQRHSGSRPAPAIGKLNERIAAIALAARSSPPLLAAHHQRQRAGQIQHRKRALRRRRWCRRSRYPVVRSHTRETCAIDCPPRAIRQPFGRAGGDLADRRPQARVPL